MARHDDDQSLVALATRVGNLASQIERLADGEEERDREIRGLRQDVAELDNDVKELAHRVPTSDQMTELQAILADRAGRKLIGKWFRIYGLTFIALLASVYAARNYIGPFFTALGRAINP